MRTISLLLIVLVAHRVASDSCHLREIDLCAATMMLSMQGGGLVPQNDDDVDTFCETFIETYECMANYTTKCMTPIQRELLQFIAEGPKKQMDNFCQKGTELRTDFLKHAPCLGEYLESDEPRKCIIDMQTAIETITEAEFDKRIATGCCGYERLMDCLHNDLLAKCGKETVDMGTRSLQVLMTELPGLICGSFEPNGPKCAGLLPPSGTQPKGADSKSSVSRLLAAFLSN